MRAGWGGRTPHLPARLPALPFRLLNEATGSLLDDVQLVNTLRTSKMTATEVTEQLETSETTEINIDLAREVSLAPRSAPSPVATAPPPAIPLPPAPWPLPPLPLP